MSNFAQGELVT